MALAFLLWVYLNRFLGIQKGYRLKVTVQSNVQRKADDKLMQKEDLSIVSAKTL